MDSVDTQTLPSAERRLSLADEKSTIESNERLAPTEGEIASQNDRFSVNLEAQQCWERYSAPARGCKEENALPNDNESWRELRLQCESSDRKNDPDNENDSLVIQGGNIAEPQSTTATESIETIDSIIDSQISNENKAKVNLSEELLKLSKYGWYWGPISGDEADSKLVSEPDGAFLVRDSSDDR